VQGDPRTHYSWLPTRAYREAFGLLTYRDALPAFQAGCASGPRSVSVQRRDGRRDLAREGHEGRARVVARVVVVARALAVMARPVESSDVPRHP
jgi:hypothetical protein